MENCGLCDEYAYYMCTACKIFLCKDHIILHNKKKGNHPNEYLGITLTSEQIFHIVEDLSMKIKVTQDCETRLIAITHDIIEKIQGMCMQALKVVQEKQEKYLNYLKLAQTTLVPAYLKEIESELQISTSITLIQCNFSKLEDFYKSNLVSEFKFTHNSSMKIYNIKQLLLNTLNSPPKQPLSIPMPINNIESAEISIGNFDYPQSLAITSDNKYVVSCWASYGGGGYGVVRIWNLDNGENFNLQGHKGSANCLAITSDNSYIVSGGHDSTVRVWSIDEKKQLFALEIQTYTTIHSIAVTIDIAYILAGSTDQIIRIWKFYDKNLYATLEGHSNRVMSIVITNDYQHIISTAQDSTIRIWNFEQQAGEIVIDTAQSCSNSIAKTSDDKYIVYCNRDYTLGLISLKERIKLADLQGHTNQVDAIAITRDNAFIVSSSQDMTVILWNLQERRTVAVLENHSARYANLIISSDDKYIISVTRDRKLLLWTLINLS